MPEKEVHVRLLRPLRFHGVDWDIGADLVMPRLTADSLVRHRAAKIIAGDVQEPPTAPIRSTETARKSPQKRKATSSTASKPRKKSPSKKKG